MIETRDLTKKYGDLFALERLSIKLEPGDVYGFIGPNGSGKTTTMRILATLLNPSWGEATVCGYSIYTGSKEIRRSIGYMPDFFGVYDDMKVLEYLEFFAAAYRITGEARRKKCEDVLEQVELGYKRDALVTSLSRGMTQRLGLARTLLHDPPVLLLDEPASGLDPRARIKMRQYIKQLRGTGKTIMLSSHILPELADICNKIGIIERGKLLFDGDVEAAKRAVRQNRVYLVAVSDHRNDDAAKLLSECPEVSAVDVVDQGRVVKAFGREGGIDTSPQRDRFHGHSVVKITLKPGQEDGSFIAERLVGSGFRLKMFAEEEIDLEDVFMGITKGITN